MTLMSPPPEFGIEQLEIENSEEVTRTELLTYKWKTESQEKQQKERYNCTKTKVK